MIKKIKYSQTDTLLVITLLRTVAIANQTNQDDNGRDNGNICKAIIHKSKNLIVVTMYRNKKIVITRINKQ